MSNRSLAISIALLLVSLLAVVLLAKKFSLVVDIAIASVGAPPAFAGVLVALLILLPESVAAVSPRRARTTCRRASTSRSGLRSPPSG